MNQNEKLHELALFAGAGGGILGGKLLGWKTICAVERDAYARDVLVARQNDGCLDPFPIWDDVCTFDGKPWRGRVDVVSGGFPCQDISAAGRGEGITGERSGLWSEMSRIIGEVGPRYVLVENSPVLTSRGLGIVLGDLAAMGYDARWGVLGAVHAGAPHKRERIWIVGYADSIDRRTGTGRQNGPEVGHASKAVADHHGLRELQPEGSKRKQRRRAGDSCCHVSDSDGERSSARIPKPPQRQEGIAGEPDDGDSGRTGESSWWLTEPELGRLAHGVANRVDRLRCLGNGQVPAVVRLAWNLLR